MSVNSKMTAIADAIRSKTGMLGMLTLDEMAEAVSGIELGDTVSVEITAGIVINEQAANGNPVKATFYGAIPSNIFYQGYNNGALRNIDISRATTIAASAFRGCRLLTDVSGDNITSITGDYIFSDCTSLITASFPKLTYVGRTGTFRNCSSLQSLTLGSVGKSVTQIVNDTFNGCTQTGLTITAYTTSGYVNTLLANIRRGATNATIVIKSSIDGSTIVISEV